ncbi:MAG: hypothetical protein R3230_07070, partial [Nitrosopumilaceae archaeon]|nr:hypothetical protein [Nitrosopumilaceae archaeon]
MTNSVYAETNDELVTKIQKLEDKITSIKERSENLGLGEKKLIAKYKQQVMEYKQLINKAEEKQKIQEFTKSELKRITAQEKFQKFHTQVYIANDKDRGINPDDTLLTALTDVVEKEDFALVSAGMDKMINQYRDAEVRAQLQEYKTIVMNAMAELEEVDNQNTEVLALTSDEVDVSENGDDFGVENEIFNAEIIKNQLKQKIKSTVTSTKVLADQIYEEQKSQYAEAKKVADKLSSSKTTT